MSSLEPCRRPAWQAPVCEDQSVSQRSSRCEPLRSQAAEGRGAAVAAAPAAGRRGRGRRSRGRATPGTSLSTTCAAAPRLPADDVAVPGVVLVDRQQRVDAGGQRRRCTIVITIPSRTPSTSAPGSRSIAKVTSSAVEDQRREAEGEDRERQGEPGEHRPDQRVEEADQRPRRRARRPAPSRTKPAAPRRAAAGCAASSSRTSRPRQTIRTLMAPL